MKKALLQSQNIPENLWVLSNFWFLHHYYCP